MNTNNIFWEEENSDSPREEESKLKTNWSDWPKTSTTDWTETWESESSDNSWQSIIVPESNFTQKLLSDDDLAEWLNAVCLWWTKHISDWDWWSIEVPDYKLRLRWIEVELRLKWKFKEQSMKDDLLDGIYVLK